MKTRLCLLSAMLLSTAWASPAETADSAVWTPPDTTRYPPEAGELSYRSTWESLAAVPGRVFYLPVWALIGASHGASVVLWDWRLPERAAAALTFADGRVGIRPESSTQIGTGARLFYRHPLARWELTSSIGRNATQRRHHLLNVRGRGWQVDGGLRREPGESYYGIGMNSRRQDRLRFTHHIRTLSLTLKNSVSRHTQVRASAGYRQVEIDEPGDSGPSLLDGGLPLPGLGDDTQLIDLGATVRLEFVDRPGSPRQGYIARLGVGLHRALDADLSYLSAHIAGERFFELFHRRALSLRFGGDWRIPLGEDEVPFFDLATVGGNQFVRGFERGRFRDRGALVGMVVYKVPVWRLLDGMWFYEGGRTFAEIEEVSLRGWRRSWGMGMRLYVPSRLLFEQRVAFSDEERRLLFLARTDF